MHIQIRSRTEKAPELSGLLQVLADKDVNLLAAGGNVDGGGEFAFAVEHGEEDRVVELLREADFPARAVEVRHFDLTDQPGQLFRAVAEVAHENEDSGRVIEDVIVGTPQSDGTIPIQIYVHDAESEAEDD